MFILGPVTFPDPRAPAYRGSGPHPVVADEAAKYSCPVTYQYVVGQAVEMAQGVKDETLSRRLRPWVMGSPR
ncbi:hypothetical protein GCM10012286_32920 [Streptomyces lasiicapitis]|uniref:Uncharacterized protein n=1 Tax=Streptomyces lasiicapitis TaxID=1923961 RepID=A0ABQ2LYX0_9ACTN|nr:hypothetical protein GCM10012286_32920 [Streptomyces lasiicapitis]